VATLSVGGDVIPLEDMDDQEDVLHSADLTYSQLDDQMELIEETESNQDKLYKHMSLF